jgi:cytochrome P450
MIEGNACTAFNAGKHFIADPSPVYNPDGYIGPVKRIEYADGHAWLITRFADAQKALASRDLCRNPGTFPDRHDTSRFPTKAHRIMTKHLLGVDPPEHTRVRRLVSGAFSPRRIHEFRPSAERIAGELLERMSEQRGVDLQSSFSYPFATGVFCEFVGFPDRLHGTFASWGKALLAEDTPENEVASVVEEMHAEVQDLLTEKRRAPAEDVLTSLAHADDDVNGRLSDLEITSMVFGIIVAGSDTTANFIGNGVFLLLTNPDINDVLLSRPALMTSTVEEFLRFRGTAETALRRYTSAPVTIGSTVIPKNEVVLISLATANRDPEVFADPDRLDIGRRENPHVAFGYGPHFCLGANLARMQSMVAFGALLKRFPTLRLNTDLDNLAWRSSSLVRGLTTLPIRW